MKIYRLEREGFGPFNVYMPSVHNTEIRKVVQSVDWTVKNTTKPRFKKGDNEVHFLYGCTSYNKLQEYFHPPVFEKLKQLGYKVIKINVPRKACRFAWDNGEIEVAFHRYHRDIKYVRVGA